MSAIAVPSDVAGVYGEVEQLINHTVWAIIRKYGGDFEELKANANLYFVKAMAKFNPEKSSLTNWVRHEVYTELLEEKRREAIRLNRTGPIAGGEAAEFAVQKEASSFLEDLLYGLSQDAQVVVKLCVETPAELAAIADAKGGTARNVRSTVKEYLLGLGWTVSRVAESFDEVREALG